MLKGWNRKVRITSAIRRAWMTTRMVSPKPLSVFVPDVTLIAFQFPQGLSTEPCLDKGLACMVAERFPHANREFRSRQENGLDTDIKGKFRRKTRIRLGFGSVAAAF